MPELVKISQVNDIGFKYGCPNAKFLPLIFFFPGAGEREGLFNLFWEVSDCSIKYKNNY